MPEYLILMPNWIGDALMALSVVTKKVEQDGRKPLLLILDYMYDLLKQISDFPLLPYDRRDKKSVRKAINIIKECELDEAYLLAHSFRTAWIVFRTGIRKRRGIAKEGRDIFLTDRLDKSIRNKKEHIINEYAAILKTESFKPVSWAGHGEGLKSDKPEYKYDIVLCPGAKYGPAKQWPYYAELARNLSPLKIAVLGTKQDQEIGNLISISSPDNVTNLAGETDLVEVAQIIKNSRLVISNDSGLMHLAGYIGTPVIGIFGSTSPDWTRPLGSKSYVVNNNLECSPCFKKTCPLFHYDCMNSISTEHIVNTANRILRKIPAPVTTPVST